MTMVVGTVADRLAVGMILGPGACTAVSPGTGAVDVGVVAGSAPSAAGVEDAAGASEGGGAGASLSGAAWYMPKRLFDCVSARSSRSAASSRSACDSGTERGAARVKAAQSATAAARMVDARMFA